MAQSTKVADDLAGMTLVQDVVAIRSDVGLERDPSATPGQASLRGLDVAELEAFRNAGWEFIAAASETLGERRRVYRGKDGRLMIDSGQLSVRFVPDTADGVIEGILSEHGLAAGRKLGFAPKLLNVGRKEGGQASSDAIDTARKLAAHPEVEYAEPVMIEHLGGRGAR